MKIVCGASVYANGEKIGRVSGVRINGHQDQVVGLVVTPRKVRGCRLLPYRQVLSAEQKRIESAVPLSSMEELAPEECQEEQWRMRRWLETLTQDESGNGAFGQFAVISREDRGSFNLPSDRPVDIEECGYGHVVHLDLDSYGYIERVGVRIFEEKNAVLTMKPEPKRSADEIVQSVHSAFHLV